MVGEQCIINPSNYNVGKYGYITPNDIFKYQQEFTAWLIETKGISIDTLLPREQKNYWAKFCDDFNTGTMAHEKYYNLDKWETEQKNSNNGNSGNGIDRIDDMKIMRIISDEELLRIEAKKDRERLRENMDKKRLIEMKKNIKKLKSQNEGRYNKLQEQHALQAKETFDSIQAKRREKNIQQNVSRHGKYGNTDVIWD